MGLAIDIENNVILKDILLKGRAEGRAEGRVKGRVEGRAEGRVEGRTEVLLVQLRSKFKRVPKWAQQRVTAATPQRLDIWIQEILTAETIEDVLGPK